MRPERATHLTRLPLRAFTLVELLVVLGIIVILAAIALPTVKNLLQDQKITQAARAVQGYFESARGRALASGRPVAVIFERLPFSSAGTVGTDLYRTNSTCVRLSMGEVFPPYEGDWAGATATLIGSPYATAAQIDVAQAASLMDTSVNPPVSSGLVSLGDAIQFSDRQQAFAIIRDPFVVMNALGQPLVQIDFANPPSLSGLALVEPTWQTVGTPLAAGAKVRFRIHRKPSKSMTGGIILPRGTCIDLAFSGSGTLGREFAPDQIQGSSTAASDSFGPVFIVFGERGTVELAYYQGRVGNSVTALQVLPTGIYHFLIGRTEQVPSPLPLPGDMLAPDAGAGVESDRDDFKSNLMDPGNVWVSINPFSGAIYTSQVTGVVAPITLPGRTAQARQLATSMVSRGGS